ncbi:MAG: PQQ-binding-like beta-propeller repeat protein [Verrucomicrobia bacterium]|nr:PQQ-binding-like beta-propeller repeat protein [Verrucomicrobiota bacterium]
MKFACSLVVTGLLAGPLLVGDDVNWPQFRGPRGDGHTASTGLPLKWSETENLTWQTPIPGKAWASPVIWGNQVWLANATEDGTELSVVCVNRETGAVERNLKLFDVEKPQFCHKFNSYASPTPVIEAGRLYVTFGSPGTACVDTATGAKLWERRDFVCNHYRGAGSSPILYGDLLLMHFDGSDHQYVVALDKRTGRTVWRTPRSIDFQDLDETGQPMIEGDLRKAFATPHVAELGGRTLMLSQGAKALYAYDPLTGEEWWRVEERNNHSASTRVVVGHGLIFAPSGFANGQLMAVRPGRQGEVIDANTPAKPGTQLEVAWMTRRGVPKKPSLALVGDLLIGIEDGGVATCWEAKTGQVVWNERIGGNYSAATLVAEGRVYFFSEEGKTTVVAADTREFNKLAESQLGDGFMASPAVSGKSLFLRSRSKLYRVEQL